MSSGPEWIILNLCGSQDTLVRGSMPGRSLCPTTKWTISLRTLWGWTACWHYLRARARTRAHTHTHKHTQNQPPVRGFRFSQRCCWGCKSFRECDTVSSGKWFPPFRRIVLPSSLGSSCARRVIEHLDRRRYRTPSKSEARCNKLRWAGHVRPVGEKRNACRILARKPEK